MKIHKGDNVIVISGADKGKEGKVIRSFPERNLVVLEGIHMRKKHQRPQKGGQKGQVILVPMPLPVSNVALVDGGKPTRAGRKLVGERWIRVSKRSGREI